MSAGIRHAMNTLGQVLSVSSKPSNKTKARPNQGKTLVVLAPATARKQSQGQNGASRTRVPRSGTRRSVQNGVTMLSAPQANGFRYGQLDLGMKDMDVTARYIAGYARVGNGTNGAAGAVYFEPTESPLVGPYTCPELVPISPSDNSTITTGIGFGTAWMNQLSQLFRRRRYDNLHLQILPYGVGSSSTSGAQLSVAPYRGSAVFTGVPATAGSAYHAQLAATTAPLPQATVLSAKGSQSFPSWQPITIDMTDFIAGGSGARQNEFLIGTDPGLSPNGTPFANVPACFAVTGSAPVALNGERIAVFIVTARMGLLDFSYLPPATVRPVGERSLGTSSVVKEDVKDRKDPVPFLRPSLSLDCQPIHNDHYATSPTNSLVERVTKAVAAVHSAKETLLRPPSAK